MSELTTRELERLTSTKSAKERREDAEAMSLCDMLEQMDKERSADAIDELTALYRDPLTGLPPEGMEPVRYRSRRELDFMHWIQGDEPAAARTRRVAYPKLDARMAREKRAR